jgi:hypothetical protein
VVDWLGRAPDILREPFVLDETLFELVVTFDDCASPAAYTWSDAGGIAGAVVTYIWSWVEIDRRTSSEHQKFPSRCQRPSCLASQLHRQSPKQNTKAFSTPGHTPHHSYP